jgi:parallel beta-helix repeat protein
MIRTVSVVLLLLAAPAIAKTIKVKPGDNAQAAIQQALLDAKPGDTVKLPKGRFELTDGLSLDVNNVILRGSGPDKTILSFKQQQGAGEGLLVTSSQVTLRDFAIEDSKGDGIKSKGSNGISFLNLRVEWTGGAKATNGAYGIYPVSSANILIEKNVVRGASDAGIYVGQSSYIIVRGNLVEKNVAGIEIENSLFADVYDNIAQGNTGGILVFDLPDLPVKGGHSTRIFNNMLLNNDTPNFAPKGNIVAQVPMGTAIMVMANRNVHIFGNNIDGNATAALMVVAYRNSFKDAAYNPLPRDIVIRDNIVGRNGFAPQFPGGAALATALGGGLPPIFWDGVERFVKADGAIRSEQVRLRIKDALPVLTLNLALATDDLSTAKPTVAPLRDPGPIAEPPPVQLPQAKGSKK